MTPLKWSHDSVVVEKKTHTVSKWQSVLPVQILPLPEGQAHEWGLWAVY